MPRRPLWRLYQAIALAVAIPVLAAGCATEEPVAPLDGQQAAANLDTEPDTSPTPGAPVPLTGFVPRSISYLNAEITVTGVEVSQQTPRSYGNATGTPEYGDAHYAYLAVKVANQLNFTTFLVQDGVFLALADDELVPLDSSGSPATDVIAPGATATGWYAFELPAGASLERASLVFGPAGHRQERLPLIGDLPTPEYPKAITVASPGTVLTGNSGCPLKVEVEEAYLAHWVGFDEDGRSHTTKQAEAGRLKLHLGLAVTGPANRSGCFIATGSGGDVHLIVDGDRLGDYPELGGTTNVAAGATDRQYLVYDIPDSGQVEIEWGRLGGKQVRIPVPLP
ncbi:hypothetical protein JMF97_15250 [Micromonospora fiedleri]|uniref:DUF4352 domain-containing protein n=1 Tax=Micromonospora fiedleri TaxID=1157498 RepID=A0ABS1UMF5_9ACTN|nr:MULTISPECIES: hypothetical protein [Micromonospora]MBL6277515.1 hypothetical protein [Micromonospora fiedleri]WSK42344.1 hypothetical protein OG712_28485 [Micromonospora maris]